MHRPIGVQNRKSMTSLKLVADTPLQQLTLTSLTLISFAKTPRRSQREINADRRVICLRMSLISSERRHIN